MWVAIKLIKAGVLSDRLIARFMRERQILASLNHPNIARLYDGGETADNAPYIVMEYVNGVPLLQWADETNADVGARLDLFYTICGATEFAHQNLIIHRDLTPSNVLVTDTGVPMLIDFGIAKPQEKEGWVDAKDDSETSRAKASLTDLSLTPGYAAPERFSGKPATTLTDIYSLGKLLAALTKNEPRDADIAAMIARASALNPEDRYPTADALARDVSRYRNGQTVDARQGGRTYVLRKFYARNKFPVLAGITGLLVLVGALATTLWAFERAEMARAESERRFTETRTVANILMFDVFDEVSKVPGAVKARVLLAETAQKYLDSLAAKKTGSVDLQLDAANGYFKLSRSIGGFQGNTLGKMKDGKPFLDRSLTILERLHKQYPQNDAVRASFGKVLSVMAGEAIYVDGDPETGRKLATRAVAMLNKIKVHTEESANALGTAYYGEGQSYAFEGEYPEAEKIFKTGIAAMEALPENIKMKSEVTRAHATLLNQLAETYANMGKIGKSAKTMERAVKLQGLTAQLTKNAPRDVRNLSIQLLGLGTIELMQGNVRAALKSAGQSVSLSREQMRNSPDDAGPGQVFVAAAIVKGQALARLGRSREAKTLVREAVELARKDLKRISECRGRSDGFLPCDCTRHHKYISQQATGRRGARRSARRWRSSAITKRASHCPNPTGSKNLGPMLETLKSCPSTTS